MITIVRQQYDATSFAPPEPDNGPALAGFTIALSAAGLLVISFGLLAIITLPMAILAIVLSNRGKRRYKPWALLQLQPAR